MNALRNFGFDSFKIKTNIFVFTIPLQDVLQKSLQDFFKTPLKHFEDVFKTFLRYPQDVLH